MGLKNPTNRGVRSDSRGDGNFGASRGDRPHKGTDFLCIPGQKVYSPLPGRIIRLARPYATDQTYSGVLIESKVFECKLFYMRLDPGMVRKWVKAGEVIGAAQNISKKYGPEMHPHIHLQIAFKPFTLINKDGTYNEGLVYVDPTLFMGV